MSIKMTEKQQELWNYINDDDTITILFGGAASSAKSYGMCLCALLSCLNKPGIVLAICRKTGSDLQRSTRQTWNSILMENNIKRDVDYRLIEMGSTFQFMNGSRVIFMNLDPAGDPTFTKVGSLSVDDVYIDEAGEIVYAAYSAIKSRLGRGEYKMKRGLPGKLIMSCNPSTNFLRKEFYDKYARLQGGESRRWQNGYTYKGDKKIPAYDCFIRATVFDNPFVSDAYIENLKSLPKLQRKRLFEGDWNFMDSDNSICSYTDIERATVFKVPDPKYEEKETGTIVYKRGKPEKEIVKNEVFTRVAGIDVAASGGDTTCLTIIDQGVVLCCEKLEVDKSAQDVSRQYWLAAKNLLKKFGFEAQYARRIVVEKNGVGLGLLTAAQTDGWMCSGQTMTGQVRSQNYYDMGLKIQRGELMFLDGFDNFEQLKDELVAHTVSFNLQEPRVVPKEKVKEALGGKSPDFADSLFWAYYAFSNSKINAEIGRTRFRIANI